VRLHDILIPSIMTSQSEPNMRRIALSVSGL
jgi:hypothetical protein